MKPLFARLIFFCALCVTRTAVAVTPEIIVTLDRDSIYIGESVGYHVLMNHLPAAGAPDTPNVDGVEFRLVNFEQKRLAAGSDVLIDGTLYHFSLTPTKAGTFVLPGPETTLDGRLVRGKRYVLEVLPPDDQDHVIIEAQSSRAAVFPTQPFTISLKILVKPLPQPYAERDPIAILSNSPALSIPWAEDGQLAAGIRPTSSWRRWLGQYLAEQEFGFVINEIRGRQALAVFGSGHTNCLPKPTRVQRPDGNGRQQAYWQYVFERQFIGSETGHFEFGPARLKGQFITEVDSAGRPKGKNFYAMTDVVRVEVRDVPIEGRPPSYAGAIGQFQLAAAIRPSQVRVGDPMTLTLQLHGQGKLDDVQPPDLRAMPDIARHFRVYEPETETQPDGRQFIYKLRPLSESVTEFPAVPFSSFDVQRQEFVTVRSAALPIEVEAAEQLAASDIAIANWQGQPAQGAAGSDRQRSVGPPRNVDRRVDRSSNSRGPQAGDELAANETSLDALRFDSVDVRRWLSVAGSLVVVYLFLAGVAKWWQRAALNADARHRRLAPRRAKQQLRRAKRSVRQPAKYAERLQTAMIALVADMLGVPASSLTSAEVCRRLEQSAVDEDFVSRLADWFARCDAVRFGAMSDETKDLGADAHRLLTDFVKTSPGRPQFRG